MPAIYPAGVVEVQGETLSLSTSLASLGMPGIETKQALIYNPATDFRLHVNPAMVEAVFYDASASSGSRWKRNGSTVNILSDLIDRDTGTGTGTLMDSMTTSDYLYLCFYSVIGGIRVVIGSANDQAATMTVKYRKNDDTWADITATDGTQTGGDTTLGATGSITWTAPTDWKAASLGGSSPQSIQRVDAVAVQSDEIAVSGFWLQIAVSATLGTNTEIDEIWALNKNTNRGYFRAGVEYPFSFDRRKVGAIEALLAAGTDTLELTWIKTVEGGG